MVETCCGFSEGKEMCGGVYGFIWQLTKVEVNGGLGTVKSIFIFMYSGICHIFCFSDKVTDDIIIVKPDYNGYVIGDSVSIKECDIYTYV